MSGSNRPPRKFTPALLDQIQNDYFSGLSLGNLAVKYKVSASGIHRAFTQHKIPMRTVQESNSQFSAEHKLKLSQSAKTRWSDPAERERFSTSLPLKEVIEFYFSEGMGKTAERFAVSKPIIRNFLIRNGIEINQPGCRIHKIGPDHPQWKGDKAGYHALHARVSKQRGKPKHCDLCDTTSPRKRYGWANMTGKYNDVNDYIRVCHKCHRRVKWNKARIS